jgi:hypothetical protein
MKVNVSTSNNGMNCIELENAPVNVLTTIRSIVMDNWIHSVRYQVSKKAGAFLQGYDESTGYLLVEFWSNNYQPFVDCVNDCIKCF